MLGNARTCAGAGLALACLCHLAGLPRGDGPDLAYALAGAAACAAWTGRGR